MPSEKLTISKISRFKYAGGWDVRWDSEVPGLGVRIYPSEKKAFVLSYRAEGRKRLMVLGRFGADLTLDEARDKARKERVTVREGSDPLEEKRKAARGETFASLQQGYIDHIKNGNKTWKADEARLDRLIPRQWQNRTVGSITFDEIETLHKRIGEDRPYAANRLVDVLRAMLNFAIQRGWGIEKTAPNPTKGIRKFKEQKRKRYAKPGELPLIAEAIDYEPDIYVRAALWLYLLTGARKRELLDARRDSVDSAEGKIKLPDTKSGEEQTLTLSAPALAILQSVPVQAGNPYIFCGRKQGKPLINIDAPWRRIRDRATVRYWAEYKEDPSVPALIETLRMKLGRLPTREECHAATDYELPSGLQDLHLHDLRRTAGSWMSQNSVDLNVIKEGLRHADIATTLVYAQLGADPARDAFEQHGQRIMQAAGKSGPVGVADNLR